MAYFISRVDDDGNELERRHSARSLDSPVANQTGHSSSRSLLSNSSVRFVNTAAYIEKSHDLSDCSSLLSEDYPNPQALDDIDDDVVPPLDLQSEENFPTNCNYTYSLRDRGKMHHDPEVAYKTWLSAKRRTLSCEAAQKKQLEEVKRLAAEERRRLAQEKYDNWLKSKAQSLAKKNASNSKKSNGSPNNSDSNNNNTNTNNNNNKKNNNSNNGNRQQQPKAQINDEEAKAKLLEWERNKRLQEERMRVLKEKEEVSRRRLIEERRNLASEAWKKWLVNAPARPKPVPLNRGILTLRGTVSDIFVNPNEWQSILTDN